MSFLDQAFAIYVKYIAGFLLFTGGIFTLFRYKDKKDKSREGINGFKDYLAALFCTLFGTVSIISAVKGQLYFYSIDNLDSAKTIVYSGFGVLFTLLCLQLAVAYFHSNRNKMKYAKSLKYRRSFIIWLLSLAGILSYSSFDSVINPVRVFEPIISSILPEGIKDESSKDIFSFSNSYYSLEKHLQFRDLSTNEPVLYDNKLYICTDENQLIVINKSDFTLDKYIEFRSIDGSIYSRRKPVVFEDKYYAFLNGGIVSGDDRVSILDMDIGKLVYEKQFKNVDFTLFEKHNEKLWFGDYGINIIGLNPRSLVEESLFYFAPVQEIESKYRSIRSNGSDTIILDNKLYVFLDDQGHYISDLNSYKTIKTGKTENDIYKLYKEYDEKILTELSNDSERRLLNMRVDEPYVWDLYGNDMINYDTPNTKEGEEYVKLTVYNKVDNQLKWRREFKMERLKYAFTNNFVFIIAQDGEFLVLDRSSGETLENYTSSMKHPYGFNLYEYDIYGLDDVLVITVDNGNLFCYERM